MSIEDVDRLVRRYPDGENTKMYGVRLGDLTREQLIAMIHEVQNQADRAAGRRGFKAQKKVGTFSD